MTVAKKVRKFLLDLYKYLYRVSYKISAVRLVKISYIFLIFKVQISEKILRSTCPGEVNKKNIAVTVKIPKENFLHHDSNYKQPKSEEK